MVRSRNLSSPAVVIPPMLEDWARLKSLGSERDSGFAAGAALSALSTLVKAEPIYLGALSERLALHAAAGTSSSLGQLVEEEQIRDEWCLRLGDETITPAGRLFAGWRSLGQLRGGTRALAPHQLAELAVQFGRPLSESPDGTLRAVNVASSPMRNPASAAAAAARVFYEVEPHQETLAHFLADATLAAKLGWHHPLPLLAFNIAAPILRSGGPGRRPVPSDPSWTDAVFGAYALSATAAIEEARGLAHKATSLLAFRAKLRAKSADRIVVALLNHAFLVGSRSIGGMSDRAMRRFYDRLHSAGIVRELTGRQTFRLYGL